MFNMDGLGMVDIFRVVGLRLLVWYKAPEDVEYLFRLGQTSFIGKKGSEKRRVRLDGNT